MPWQMPVAGTFKQQVPHTRTKMVQLPRCRWRPSCSRRRRQRPPPRLQRSAPRRGSQRLPPRPRRRRPCCRRRPWRRLYSWPLLRRHSRPCVQVGFVVTLAGSNPAAPLTARVSRYLLLECLQFARAPVVNVHQQGQWEAALSCSLRCNRPFSRRGPRPATQQAPASRTPTVRVTLATDHPLPCDNHGALVCRGPFTLTPYCFLPVDQSCNPDVRERPPDLQLGIRMYVDT